MMFPNRLRFVPGCLAALLAAASPAPAEPTSSPPCQRDAAAVRTLDDVLERVRQSARGDAVAGEIAATEALERQAAARPNPQLELELEDFTGSGRYSDFGQSQTTLSVAQSLELGGRRAQRREVAARETGAEKARGAQELVRMDVAARQAFVEVAAARARRDVTVEGEDLARDVLAEARRRAQGGAGSAADVERATVALATASLDATTSALRADVAAQRLAALWGGSMAETACLDARFPRMAAAPASAEGRTSPAVEVARAEVEVRRAQVASAKAQAAPDLAVAAGLRHLAGPGDVSLVTGVVVELPLFDRNTGNVRAAEQRLYASQARARVAEQEAAARLARLRADVDVARERAKRIERETVPAAERAYEALRRAWQGGAASSLDVLDARRSLVALRLEQVDALAEFHSSLAALEGASGAIGAGPALERAGRGETDIAPRRKGDGAEPARTHDDVREED